MDIIYLIVGLAGLVFGGNWLITGASRIAESFRIPHIIIGLTIVAFGTSAPELLVNVSAVINGSTDLALGNVVGSNIANIGLILGITGLLAPIAVHSVLVRREIPILSRHWWHFLWHPMAKLANSMASFWWCCLLLSMR